MQKNHFLLLKKFKNIEGAQLWLKRAIMTGAEVENF